MILIMKLLNFLSRNDFSKIEQKNNICINVFCYENELTYPVYVSDQTFKDCVDLLLISDKNKSHMSILKILTDLCVTRQKLIIKNNFANIVYNVLVVKEF